MPFTITSETSTDPSAPSPIANPSERTSFQTEINIEFVDPEVTEEKTIAAEPNASFWRLFVPSSNYMFTPGLVLVNTLVFFLMVYSGVSFLIPETEQLINWGANFTVLTLTGQWWRLLTACFLHMGFIHLALNILALLSLGQVTERVVGSFRFFIIYLIAGIGGSLCSLWWHDQVVSVGASGAIFGILGLSFALVLVDEDQEAAVKKARLLRILGLIAMNLFYGLQGNIDNAAHIGGLISGVLCGFALQPSLRNPALIKANIGFLTGGSFFIFVILFQVIPKGNAQFQAAFSEFATNEEKVISLYNEIANNENIITNSDYLPQLEKAIEQCRLNQEKFQQLRGLPVNLTTRRYLLVRYNYLWSDTFKLLAARIRSNYLPISPDINERIDSANYIVKVFENTEAGEETAYMDENPFLVKPMVQPSSEILYSDQPLFELDGKILRPNQPNQEPSELKNLAPSDIASVQVIKEKEALEKYGPDGKNGVFVIITKKSQRN